MPVVLAAGTGWRSLDFFGGIFLKFNGVLPASETVFFFFFFFFFWGGGGHFSVTYNVSFTKIVRKSMPIDYMYFFLHFP